MMYELRFEDENGKSITISGREDKYQIVGLTGLNPPNATLHFSDVTGMDGGKFISSKLEKRNIVLTVCVKGKVEANRLELYSHFKTKHYTKMYYKNGTLDVYAEGYVESIESDYFTQREELQISILCPDPYFYDLLEMVSDISKVVGAFEFPFTFGAEGVRDVETNALIPTDTDEAIEFSIYDAERIAKVVNEGEDDTGIVIEIFISGNVVNPIIHNDVTKEKFQINGEFKAGDEITINTIKGRKKVSLLRDGKTTNLINKVDRRSSWLSLAKGENYFTYEADVGMFEMRIIFTFKNRYQGV